MRRFALTVAVIWLCGGAQAQEADYAKGLQYHSGDGVVQNYATAATFFAEAAALGHAPAQNFMGRYLFEGLGVAQDVTAAIAFLEQAAESGDAQHVFDLAKVLEQNENSVARAAALYEQAVAQGHLEASVNLGLLFQEGRGVVQNYQRAHALYLPAAEQGNARALNNLGLLYVRGTGVAQDYTQAATYLTAAAEQGLQTAMTNLGVLYENGFGVPLNEARATELYRLGGRGDDAALSAQRFVYDVRLKPLNLTQDTQAVLMQAANAGDPIAQFQLGWALMQQAAAPHAVQARAAQLFERAALAGHGPAMVNLGAMYARGEGVPQDYVLAQKWLLLGQSLGVDGAMSVVPDLARRLTPDQINLAQDLAAQEFGSP